MPRARPNGATDKEDSRHGADRRRLLHAPQPLCVDGLGNPQPLGREQLINMRCGWNVMAHEGFHGRARQVALEVA